MQNWMVILIASVVVLLAVDSIVYNRRRSKRLQERFGSAYDQTVSEIGNRREAEAQLLWRELHARQLRARPLGFSDREKFTSQWKQCQALFVDDPAGAVEDADELLVQIMRIRGYTADNAHERRMDVAAAYPRQAERYRQAGEIIEAHRRSPVTTDKLRTAFLNYRDLFDDLIEDYDEKLNRAA